MNENLTPDLREEVRNNAGWMIVLSILLIILGAVLVFAPAYGTLFSVLILGWILLISGVVRIVKAFKSRGVRGFWLNLLVGILYLLAGIITLANPIGAALSLTLVIGILFLAEGVYDIIMAFKVKPGGGLSWLVLLDGIITLILGILVLNSWPFSALWLIGLYVGISIIFSGATLLAISLAARKAVAEPGVS